MIDPLVYFSALLLAMMLCQLTARRWQPLMLAGCGAALLGVFAPAAAGFLMLSIIQAYVLARISLRFPRSHAFRKYGTYAILLNLLFVDFNNLLMGFHVETIAISFALIRLFMTSKQMVSSRKDLSVELPHWLFVGTFYLPAIMVGPVFSATDLRKQAQQGEVDLGGTAYLYRKLLTGLALATLAASFVDQIEAINLLHTMVLSFLVLYFSFWGQSLMAEMSSRLMGFSIPANFNRPWLATDIKDFWKRWHISMAGFVMQYIYLPLTIKGVSPRLATVCAFVFMGLWHEVAPGYIIWGLAHGVLMVRWPDRFFSGGPVPRMMGRAATITVVILLSYVANRLWE